MEPATCSSASSRISFPFDHPLAHVDGATNAVVAEGNFSGRLLFQGAGAGDGPTASAVVADIIDIARGEIGAPFSVPVAELEAMPPAASGHRVGRTYVASRLPTGRACWRRLPPPCAMPVCPSKSLIQKGRAEAGGEVLVRWSRMKARKPPLPTRCTCLKARRSFRRRRCHAHPRGVNLGG